MAGEVARIAKPNLRGLLNKQIGINLGVTCVLMTAIVAAMKFGITDVRKSKYAEYYRLVYWYMPIFF